MMLSLLCQHRCVNVRTQINYFIQDYISNQNTLNLHSEKRMIRCVFLLNYYKLLEADIAQFSKEINQLIWLQYVMKTLSTNFNLSLYMEKQHLGNEVMDWEREEGRTCTYNRIHI